RRWVAVSLAALALPAAALAIPAVRHALGIGAHLRVVVVKKLPRAPLEPRTRGRITTVRGHYVIKFATPDTRVIRLEVRGLRGAYLAGGRHMLAIERPDGTAFPLDIDRGNTLVYERRGTVVRVTGVRDLRAARALLRSRA